MGFNTLGDSGSSILQAGARLFWLSMISLVITLPRRRYGVGAISFVHSGFKSTDLYTVPGSPRTVNSTAGAFCLAYPTDVYNSWYTTSVRGRFMCPQYPQLGQVKYSVFSYNRMSNASQMSIDFGMNFDLSMNIMFNSTSSAPGPPSPTMSSVQLKLKIIFGTVGGIVFGLCCWKIYRIFFYPIIFFLAHASGDGTTKDFTERLSNEMRRTWICKLHLIRVFFDKNSLPMGLSFPKEIHLALSQTRVGVVIVTKDFFEGKWPMNELLSLVKSSETSSRKVRILPLFYTIDVKEVRTKLNDGDWDEKWRQMSTLEHPIDVEECRKAVVALCNAYGVDYPFKTHSYDADYIKLALKAVCKTYNQMLLWS